MKTMISFLISLVVGTIYSLKQFYSLSIKSEFEIIVTFWLIAIFIFLIVKSGIEELQE